MTGILQKRLAFSCLGVRGARTRSRKSQVSSPSGLSADFEGVRVAGRPIREALDVQGNSRIFPKHPPDEQRVS